MIRNRAPILFEIFSKKPFRKGYENSVQRVKTEYQIIMYLL